MRTRNHPETRQFTSQSARWSSFPPVFSTLPPEARPGQDAGGVSQVPASEVQRSRPERPLGADGLVQTLLNSSLDGVLVLDARLHVSAVNSALVVLAETSNEALLQHHVLDVFPLMQQLGPDVFEFVLQGRTLGGELDCVKPEQKTGSCFEIKLTPIFEAGSVVGILGIVREVSQHRDHASRLSHMQKLALAARLATGSAHDLSNLLTVVHAEVSRALILCEDNELRESLVEIRECTERSGVLTREVLNFSRKNAEHPTRVRAAQVLTDSQRMFERLLGPNIELCYTIQDEAVCVSAHRGQLEQVLANLVANARDAMPEGGKLEISLKRARVLGDADDFPDGGLTSELSPGDYCCIQVRDTGHGMSDSVKGRLFEAFFTTKAEGTGTGLGLATSREIIEASGGSVRIKSAVLVGTEVSIYLPEAIDQSALTVRPRAKGPSVRKTTPSSEADLSRAEADASGYFRVSDPAAPDPVTSEGEFGSHPSDRPRTGSEG